MGFHSKLWGWNESDTNTPCALGLARYLIFMYHTPIFGAFLGTFRGKLKPKTDTDFQSRRGAYTPPVTPPRWAPLCIILGRSRKSLENSVAAVYFICV